MRNLEAELEEAEARLALLKQLQAAGNCAENGHEMVFYGGAWAGCCAECSCSVPVYHCKHCGLCDYGDNEEAEDIRKECGGIPDCDEDW